MDDQIPDNVLDAMLDAFFGGARAKDLSEWRWRMRAAIVALRRRGFEPSRAGGASAAPLPWQTLSAEGWAIVGMNHYRQGGERHLFCSMARHGRCITAEGSDERAVFEDLQAQAARVDASEH